MTEEPNRVGIDPTDELPDRIAHRRKVAERIALDSREPRLRLMMETRMTTDRLEEREDRRAHLRKIADRLNAEPSAQGERPCYRADFSATLRGSRDW